MPTCMLRAVAALSAGVLLASAEPALRAVRLPDNGLAIHRGDGERPILVQNARADFRAYIHPLVAPDGKGVLTEDAPGHHRWQHGLYVGLNDVNGVNFWSDDRRFRPQPLAEPLCRGNTASWSVVSQWNGPVAGPMLVETQAWTLTDLGDRYHLDLAWTLTADIDLTFGQHQYGGLFLRMPHGGTSRTEVVAGDGRRRDQMRSRWVAVQMEIAGRDDGSSVAIFDHPSNPGHPSPWRIDRQAGISPSRCIAGAWTLAKGASATARYRVLVQCGRPAAAAIEPEFARYAAADAARTATPP